MRSQPLQKKPDVVDVFPLAFPKRLCKVLQSHPAAALNAGAVIDETSRPARTVGAGLERVGREVSRTGSGGPEFTHYAAPCKPRRF